MHRSGTSFLARALNLSGVYLGPPEDFVSDELRPAVDNLKGHWENKKFLTLSGKTLKLNKGSWDNPPEKIKITKKLGKEISDECKRLYDHPSLASGFKDPRTILCADSWFRYLPKNIVIVGIFRDPLKTAESLKTRDSFSYKKSLELWKIYNQTLLSLLKRKNGFLLNFDWPKHQLISEIQTLSKKLGLLETDLFDWFSKELLHSDKKYKKTYSLPKEIRVLNKELKQRSQQNNKTRILVKHAPKDFKEALLGFQEDSRNQNKYFQLVNKENLEIIKNLSSEFRTNPMGVLLLLYLKRKDLKKAFPEVKKGNYKGLLDWAIKYGTKERESYELSPFKEWYLSFRSTLDSNEKLVNQSKKLENTISKLRGTENELTASKAKFDEKSAKLKTADKQLNATRAKLDETLDGLGSVENELAEKNTKFVQTLFKLTATEEQLDSTKTKLNETVDGLSSVEDELSAKNTMLDETLSKLNSRENQLDETKTKLTNTEEQFGETKTKLTNTEEQLSETKTKLTNTEEQFDETKTKLTNTEEQFGETKTKLTNTEEQFGETKTKLTNTEDYLHTTKTKLNETLDGLSSVEGNLEDKKKELNAANLELEGIKSTTSFYVINKIFRWIDKKFPINTKRREPLRLLSRGVFILRTEGFRGLSMAYKEDRRIKQKNRKRATKISKKIESVPLEEGFVCGIDSDLNSKISENNRTILIRGWCYHKNSKIKKLYIGFNGTEERISNFGFPRTDVMPSQGHPNSANSGFWKIVTIPKINNDVAIFLRAILKNHDQVKQKITTLQIKKYASK